MLIMRAVVKALEKVENEVTGIACYTKDETGVIEQQKSHVIGMLNGILDMLNEYIKVKEGETKKPHYAGTAEQVVVQALKGAGFEDIPDIIRRINDYYNKRTQPSDNPESTKEG